MTKEQGIRAGITLALLVLCWFGWGWAGWLIAAPGIEMLDTLSPILRPVLIVLALTGVQTVLQRVSLTRPSHRATT